MALGIAGVGWDISVRIAGGAGCGDGRILRRKVTGIGCSRAEKRDRSASVSGSGTSEELERGMREFEWGREETGTVAVAPVTDESSEYMDRADNNYY